ncbi:hypothetical protein PoB_000230500 [Plakobranchus ocellatus]|uniref:Uncharacterized protein n=1 Tax=Plakobranchus ocellatus TaxID=259542 RepID=A0AAV3XYA2_9GAST|nr:hypothetical protein PoB_000230500 [Plakobranchus ocellatus]
MNNFNSNENSRSSNNRTKDNNNNDNSNNNNNNSKNNGNNDDDDGQGAGGRARTRDRRVPADLRADCLATVPPTPHHGLRNVCVLSKWTLCRKGLNQRRYLTLTWSSRTDLP